jgi:TorA maturation chaperone TorD
VSAPDEIDLARAQEYALLSSLLLKAPSSELLAQLASLRGDATQLGKVHAELAGVASKSRVESVEREHFLLFSGVGRGELLPYASYYLTGFVQGRPLADLRQTLSRLGIELSDEQSEPEDHAGVLLEIMAGMAQGGWEGPLGTERAFFSEHLEPWISRFFADLERTQSARFYATVGTLGRTFIEIERRGFELSEPNA